jgi:hypothetical protein
MKSTARALVLLCCLVALGARGDSTDEPRPALENNRALLGKWKQDPEHFRRLLQDLREFKDLPAERQERMRQLDRDIQDEDPARQARYQRVMQRYVYWLHRLPEEERQRIEAAPDASSRLAVIKEICEKQWLVRQPRSVQEQVRAAEGAERSALIEKLRREERASLSRTADAPPPLKPRPTRLVDFPPDVQDFVKDTLMPMLSEEEKQRLQSLTGTWPFYVHTLVDLSSKHPIALPGPTAGPTNNNALPTEFRKALKPNGLDPAQKQRLQQTQGSWPEYSKAVAEAARSRNVPLPGQWWPAKVDDFSPAIRKFIADDLYPAIENVERDQLKAVEGLWPEYPQRLMDLAKKHSLTVPGTRLPGPAKYWDEMRMALPDVPGDRLRIFATTELSREDLAKLGPLVTDPASRERVKREFFRKHPDAYQRLLEQAIRKPAKNPTRRSGE